MWIWKAIYLTFLVFEETTAADATPLLRVSIYSIWRTRYLTYVIVLVQRTNELNLLSILQPDSRTE